MKRRTFINYIGSAVIGTAIALKLPDGLVPLNHLSDRPRISFKALQDAYNKAFPDGKQPQIMMISQRSMLDARNQMNCSMLHSQSVPLFVAPYFFFQGATVIDDPEIPDDVIQTHGYRSEKQEFYFA